MSGKKNNRQRQRRQQAARQARARAAAQRQQHVQSKKRRTTVVFVCLGLAALTLLAVALSNSTGGGSTKVTTSSTASATTGSTEAAAGESVKGKPCVAQATPSPAGAPTVPVKVGPPPTSLVIEDLTPGTGAVVAKDATVTVNYIGVSCSSGAVFDTSYGKQPATFSLNGVIKGWTDGIPGMKVGGRRLLGIPSDLAYGPTSRSADIKADESLWFVIDVISVS